MNRRSKVAIAATAIGITLFGFGAYSGYLFGRSRVSVPTDGPKVKQIASGAWDTAWTASTGSTHLDGYSIEAFRMVNGQIRDIIRSIVGDDYLQFYAYVLPEGSGGFFTLVIHTEPTVPDLTEKQHSELIDLVRKRLYEETLKWQRKTDERKR